MPKLIRALLLVVVSVSLPLSATAAELRQLGAVLIHGKAGVERHLSGLAAALAAEGVLVATPQMSWTRAYRTYDETLQEIDREVLALRAKGARQVVLVGHSLGANVALGYAAIRGGVAGVAALAPGHRPERIQDRTAESRQRAQAMVAAGRGNDVARFIDVNQGRTFEVQTSAAAYLSFFDPQGPAVIMNNAARLRETPVLWAIGRDDRAAQGLGRDDQWSRVVNVDAGHLDTPAAAVGHVMQWLRSLGR